MERDSDVITLTREYAPWMVWNIPPNTPHWHTWYIEIGSPCKQEHAEVNFN